VCFHPGSATDGDRDAAAERVARAIAAALEEVQGPTRLLVENSAGAGQTFGRSAVEVRDILAHVPVTLRDRTGYGLDTCHMFASGYNIAESEAAQRTILEEWENTVGEAPAFFHLNDSEGALGSNRDRHLLIGEGQIGREPFRWLLRDSRSRGIPLILETPHANPDLADDDPSADPYEVRMLGLLRELAG
jgi:deoxyribonuclease-4